MGQPFKASFVERFVGHCDSCGLSSRGAGVRSGRAATICWNCSEQIARVVSAQFKPETRDGPATHVEPDGVAWPTPEPTPTPTDPTPDAAPLDPPPSAKRTQRARRKA